MCSSDLNGCYGAGRGQHGGVEADFKLGRDGGRQRYKGRYRHLGHHPSGQAAKGRQHEDGGDHGSGGQRQQGFVVDDLIAGKGRDGLACRRGKSPALGGAKSEETGIRFRHHFDPP